MDPTTKISSFQEHSCGILSSFKIMITINNTSAYFVLIAADSNVEITEDRATVFLK